jgi:hypothetical protein
VVDSVASTIDIQSNFTETANKSDGESQPDPVMVKPAPIPSLRKLHSKLLKGQ